MADSKELQEHVAKLKQAFGDIDTAVTKYASLVTDLRKLVRSNPDLMVFSPYANECLKTVGSLGTQIRQSSQTERLLMRIEAGLRAEQLEKERQEKMKANEARRKKAKSTVSNASLLPPDDNSFDELFPLDG
jgi:hypothetical protein